MNEGPGQSPFRPGAPRRGAQSRRRWSYQLSLATVVLIMSVVTAALAPLAYLTRAMRGSHSSHFVFILFCLAAPAVALVVTSVAVAMVHWWRDKH